MAYEKWNSRIEDKQWLADAEQVDPSVNEQGYVNPRALEKAAGILQRCVKYLQKGVDEHGIATMTDSVLESMKLLLKRWAPNKADGEGVTNPVARHNMEAFRGKLNAYKAKRKRFGDKRHHQKINDLRRQC